MGNLLLDVFDNLVGTSFKVLQREGPEPFVFPPLAVGLRASVTPSV
jgi:hypothetical protein